MLFEFYKLVLKVSLNIFQKSSACTLACGGNGFDLFTRLATRSQEIEIRLNI